MNNTLEFELIELLKKENWKTGVEKGNKMIYKVHSSGDINYEYIFSYDENGLYKYNRGTYEKIFDYDSIEKNLLSLYIKECEEAKKDRIETEKTAKEISTKSQEEIDKLFSDAFTQDFLINNLNMNTLISKNNSFNITETDNFYLINFIKDNKKVVLKNILKKQGKQTLIANIYSLLLLKKNFDRKFEKYITNLNLTTDEVLQMFSLYCTNSKKPVINLEELNVMLNEAEDYKSNQEKHNMI